MDPFSAIIPPLKAGKIGVLPTDTIYGIVGAALDRRAVERIYRTRKRNPKKPMIILVASEKDIARFGVRPDAATKRVLARVWPGKVSVVVAIARGNRAARKKFAYLHRGTGTLAFRVPKPAWLRALIRATGPLVAPSANIEGEAPARTIRAARRYFNDAVDFYVDVGRMTSKPSKLIAVQGGATVVLRK